MPTIANRYYSYNGEWISQPAGPVVPPPSGFTFLDPTLPITIGRFLPPVAPSMASATAAWDGVDLVITWDGGGATIIPAEAGFSVDLVDATSFYPHPRDGIDAPSDFLGMTSWTNGEMQADIIGDFDSMVMVAWVDDQGVPDFSLAGNWVLDLLGTYPNTVWNDWATYIDPAAPTSPPLPSGYFSVWVLPTGVSVGSGEVRIRPTTKAEWSDTDISTRQGTQADTLRRRVQMEFFVAMRAVRNLGTEVTRESLIPHLKTVTIEQVEAVFGSI